MGNASNITNNVWDANISHTKLMPLFHSYLNSLITITHIIVLSVAMETAMIVTSSCTTWGVPRVTQLGVTIMDVSDFRLKFWGKNLIRLCVQVIFPKSEVRIFKKTSWIDWGFLLLLLGWFFFVFYGSVLCTLSKTGFIYCLVLAVQLIWLVYNVNRGFGHLLLISNLVWYWSQP